MNDERDDFEASYLAGIGHEHMLQYVQLHREGDQYKFHDGSLTIALNCAWWGWQSGQAYRAQTEAATTEKEHHVLH